MIQVFQYPHESLNKVSSNWTKDDSIEGYTDIEKFEYDMIKVMLESRGMGGSKNKDYIENLMGLCRDCHNKAESDSAFNMFCRIKHLEQVCDQVYAKIEYQKIYESRKNKNK